MMTRNRPMRFRIRPSGPPIRTNGVRRKLNQHYATGSLLCLGHKT